MLRLRTAAIGAGFVLASIAPGAAAPPVRAAPRARSGFRAAAYPPSGFTAMRVRFEHSLIADDGILVANYERRFGITTAFVQLGGDDVAGLIDRNPTTVKNFQAMMAAGNVYLVIGDPAWLATPSTVPPDVATAATIARAYPKLAGVLFDLDPAKLPAWNGSARATLVSEYLTLVGSILSAPAVGAFKDVQFVADPQFAAIHQNGNPNRPTLLQTLESAPAIGALQLEVPGRSAQVQIANAAPAIAQMTKPFFVVASTSKYSPASYYGVAPEYLRISLTDAAEHFAQANPNFDGTTVDGWNDLYNGLQSIFPQPPVFDGILATGSLVPPSGTTYLGAYVNALGVGQSIAETAVFEERIGRPLAFDLEFYQWQASFPTAKEQDDVAHGRIPVIAWNCGDSDANVANGADDALIAERADALKAFGAPVMLRWFWEPNLNDENDPPRTQCWDRKSDFAGGYFAPLRYIAAWQHIRTVFANRGVTNVIWLWTVANAHGGAAQYYPGDDEIDWVGLDDYDTVDQTFADTLYIPTNALAQFQEKPFMVNETGAHASNQVDYFSGAAETLQMQFPWVRALGYFDSTGTSQNWILTGRGLSVFTSFANDPYMSARAVLTTNARRHISRTRRRDPTARARASSVARAALAEMEGALAMCRAKASVAPLDIVGRRTDSARLTRRRPARCARTSGSLKSPCR